MSSVSLVRFDRDGDVIMQTANPRFVPANLRSLASIDFEGDVIMRTSNPIFRQATQRPIVQSISLVFNSIQSSFEQNQIQNFSVTNQTPSRSVPAVRNSIPEAAIQKLSRLAQPAAHLRPQQMPKAVRPNTNQNRLPSLAAAQTGSRSALQDSFLRPPQQMPKAARQNTNQNRLSSIAAAQGVSVLAPLNSHLRLPQTSRTLSPIPVQNSLRSIQQTSQRILRTQSSSHSNSTSLSAPNANNFDERDLFPLTISARQSGNDGTMGPNAVKHSPTISLPSISESPPPLSRSISGNLYDNSNLNSQPKSPPPFSDGDSWIIKLDPPPEPKRRREH